MKKKGRPKNEKKNTHFYFSLSPEDKERWEALARKEGIPVASLIRKIVNKEVNKETIVENQEVKTIVENQEVKAKVVISLYSDAIIFDKDVWDRMSEEERIFVSHVLYKKKD